MAVYGWYEHGDGPNIYRTADPKDVDLRDDIQTIVDLVNDQVKGHVHISAIWESGRYMFCVGDQAFERIDQALGVHDLYVIALLNAQYESYYGDLRLRSDDEALFHATSPKGWGYSYEKNDLASRLILTSLFASVAKKYRGGKNFHFTSKDFRPTHSFDRFIYRQTRGNLSSYRSEIYDEIRAAGEWCG